MKDNVPTIGLARMDEYNVSTIFDATDLVYLELESGLSFSSLPLLSLSSCSVVSSSNPRIRIDKTCGSPDSDILTCWIAESDFPCAELDCSFRTCLHVCGTCITCAELTVILGGVQLPVAAI